VNVKDSEEEIEVPRNAEQGKDECRCIQLNFLEFPPIIQQKVRQMSKVEGCEHILKREQEGCHDSLLWK